ncbi:uncharacterized protein LOC134840747 [Symsagittifera roscoffensis]|uniref:uncharacterized protein LOC134840747 n=1 Tax=Symsagittifera roscoffensis TaxID=84072 RepID=UPI00307B983E
MAPRKTPTRVASPIASTKCCRLVLSTSLVMMTLIVLLSELSDASSPGIEDGPGMKGCPDNMFSCSQSRLHCIKKEKLCDAFINCENGADEAAELCIWAGSDYYYDYYADRSQVRHYETDGIMNS